MIGEGDTIWPIQRTLSNLSSITSPNKSRSSSLHSPIKTIEKTPQGLVRSFTTFEKPRKASRPFLTSPTLPLPDITLETQPRKRKGQLKSKPKTAVLTPRNPIPDIPKTQQDEGPNAESTPRQPASKQVIPDILKTPRTEIPDTKPSQQAVSDILKPPTPEVTENKTAQRAVLDILKTPRAEVPQTKPDQEAVPEIQTTPTTEDPDTESTQQTVPRIAKTPRAEVPETKPAEQIVPHITKIQKPEIPVPKQTQESNTKSPSQPSPSNQVARDVPKTPKAEVPTKPEERTPRPSLTHQVVPDTPQLPKAEISTKSDTSDLKLNLTPTSGQTSPVKPPDVLSPKGVSPVKSPQRKTSLVKSPRKKPKLNTPIKLIESTLLKTKNPATVLDSPRIRTKSPNIEAQEKFISPYKKEDKVDSMDSDHKLPAFTIKSSQKLHELRDIYTGSDKAVEALTGMDSARPAFTIKPTNGGPTTSTPKPTLFGNSNSVSLRKMTSTEIKLSPADKAMMEENRAKMAQLEKDEENLKAKLNLAEQQEKKKEELKTPRSKTDLYPSSNKDTSERPSVKGNVMVATDPSTFARNSISTIYTPRSKPSLLSSEGEDKKPAFDPDVFAKTVIKSNLNLSTPRKEATTTTTIASTTIQQPQPVPVEQPHSVADSGIEVGHASNTGTEETQKEKRKEKRKRHKERPKTLNDYEKMLKCSRCKKRYVDPKIVCCQRMCVECLQKTIDQKAKSGNFVCKVCNRPVTIPDPSKPRRSWAKQFPTDQFLAHLKEAVVQLEGKRLCYVCDSRSKVTDATMFCYECDTYFCDTCDDAHRHMPKLQHHRLISLNDLTPTELLKNKRRSCSIHGSKTVELFCKDCNMPMCADCASTIHQKCTNVSSIANVADEKKKLLRSTEKSIKAGIVKCETSSKRLKTEGAEIAEVKKQTVEQIDGAFHAVSDALHARKKKLMKDINTHFNQDVPQFEKLSKQMEKMRVAMKTNTEFINELMNHASDLDVIENADRVRHQADVMIEHNAEVTETPKPKILIRMDDMSVQNFVELVSLLGAEVGTTQVKGVLVKKMTTKMSGDQSIPDIRDIVVMDSGALLAIDNKNSCVKGIIFKGEHFSVKRLDLKSQPWGGAKLQDNMIAVSGLKCFYIVSLTDDLTLQTVVHTRKDYWGICALSPINLACSCKYPPCVDIVDITGRRLRTIDTDQQGYPLFEMPGYLANVGGRIVVSDRTKKSVICVDQLGEVIFNYQGEGQQELSFPRGLCVDRLNRIYVADHDKGCVYLLSPEGKYLGTVIKVPKPRTICLDTGNNTLYVSMEGKGITFFNIIEVKTT